VRVVLALAVILSVAILASIPLHYVEGAEKWPKSYIPGWEKRDFVYHPLPNGCFRVEVVEEEEKPPILDIPELPKFYLPENVTASEPAISVPPVKLLSDVELAELVEFLVREAGIYEDVRNLMASFRCVVGYYISFGSRVYYVVTLAFHSLPGQAEGSSKSMLVPFWVEWRGVVDGRNVSVRGYVISVMFEAYREGGEWKLYKWYPNPDVAIPLPGPVKSPDLVRDAVKAERLAREWLKDKGVKGAIVKFTNIIEDSDRRLANVVAVDCRGADDWTLWRIVVDLNGERVVEDMSRPALYWGPPWRCLG